MSDNGPWAHSKNEAGERYAVVAHLTEVAVMERTFADCAIAVDDSGPRDMGVMLTRLVG